MFTNVLEAFGTLLENCIKVVKVNLETDTYEIIKIHPEEQASEVCSSFSLWLFNFADNGNV